jgi:hypothetical protein
MLVDSCTTNTILRETKYFQTLAKRMENILTNTRRDTCIVGSGKATIILPMGTQVLFTARYDDCIFNEDHFLTLEKDYKYYLECQEINWDDKSILSSDPHTKETKL